MLNQRPLLGDLLHLISNFSGPQTPSGFPRAPSAGCGFPYHISSPTVWNPTSNSTGSLGVELNWNQNSIQLACRTQLSYIIVRRPLDLWNRMFNRHQAEITVMQFRGHSLPVHHSVVYHGNFFSSSHFISQFPPTRFPLLTAIGMCHFLPVHHLEWHFWPGQKVKTQQVNNSLTQANAKLLGLPHCVVNARTTMVTLCTRLCS